MKTQSKTQTQSKPLNSLGAAQHTLELATRRLTAAQEAFRKARDTLEVSQVAHDNATMALNDEVATIKTKTRVKHVNAD